MRKSKLPSTTLNAVEKLFGPVLPGTNAPDRTISVFQEYTSPKRYKLIGRVGIVDGAIWHLYTQVPIDPLKVKGYITGILEGGKQHDPCRRQLAATWLSDHLAKKAVLDQKAAAAELKKREGERKKFAASRAGEYDAKLLIGGSIDQTLIIRVKVNAKGEVAIVLPKGKKLHLPPA